MTIGRRLSGSFRVLVKDRTFAGVERVVTASFGVAQWRAEESIED